MKIKLIKIDRIFITLAKISVKEMQILSFLANKQSWKIKFIRVFNIANSFKRQISALEGFLKNPVTLKAKNSTLNYRNKLDCTIYAHWKQLFWIVIIFSHFLLYWSNKFVVYILHI